MASEVFLVFTAEPQDQVMNTSILTMDAVVFNRPSCFRPKRKTISFVRTNGWVKKSPRLSIGEDSLFLSTIQHQETVPDNAIHYVKKWKKLEVEKTADSAGLVETADSLWSETPSSSLLL